MPTAYNLQNLPYPIRAGGRQLLRQRHKHDHHHDNQLGRVDRHHRGLSRQRHRAGRRRGRGRRRAPRGPAAAPRAFPAAALLALLCACRRLEFGDQTARFAAQAAGRAARPGCGRGRRSALSRAAAARVGSASGAGIAAAAMAAAEQAAAAARAALAVGNYAAARRALPACMCNAHISFIKCHQI